MVQDSAATIERWFFYQDVAALWKWARIDVFGTVLSYSAASFATRDACVEDARRGGYAAAPQPAAEPATFVERRAPGPTALSSRL